MPVLDEKECESEALTAEEFGRQLKANGDLAVNFKTGAMFKGIMKGILRDVTSGFKSEPVAPASSTDPSRK